MRSKHIMLAYPYDTKRLERMQRPFIVQPKLDGIRCMAFIKGTDVNLTSSQGNIIGSVPHINRAIKDWLSVTDTTNDIVALDGELYVHGMNFQDIVSIAKRTKNLHQDYMEMEFHVFDVIHKQPMTQSLRLQTLIAAMDSMPFKTKQFVRRVPNWICMTKDEIGKMLYNCMELGYEGVIIRDSKFEYKGGRSTKMLKYKPSKSDEYRVVGWNEEVSIDGEPKNAMGSFICECEKSGELFNVGTGPFLTRAKREECWNQRKEITNGNYYANVKYQELTKDRQIPRFPVIIDLVSNKR